MAIPKKTVLEVEALEDRATPAIIGYLGGGYSAVFLQQTAVLYQLVTPGGHVLIISEPISGLLQAVQGGGGVIDT